MLKVGDLVEEIIPLAAGDAPARMGILVKQSFPLLLRRKKRSTKEGPLRFYLVTKLNSCHMLISER